MDLSKARVLFFEEAYELCDTLESALLNPETYPPNTATFNLIFRTAHTIKGSAGIFGLEALVRFAHVIENILERLRSNQLVLTDELVSLLLTSNDHLRHLLHASAESETQALLDLPEGLIIIENLYQYQTSHLATEDLTTAPEAIEPDPIPSPIVATSLWHLSLRFHPNTFRDGFDPLSFLYFLQNIGSIEQIQMVWRPWPQLQILDPTECFMGFEIGLNSQASAEKISSTFDFVKEDSLISILPPMPHWRFSTS